MPDNNMKKKKQNQICTKYFLYSRYCFKHYFNGHSYLSFIDVKTDGLSNSSKDIYKLFTKEHITQKRIKPGLNPTWCDALITELWFFFGKKKMSKTFFFVLREPHYSFI